MKRVTDEVRDMQRISAAEVELAALCNRHKVVLVYETGVSTDGGNFSRFRFKLAAPGQTTAAASVLPVDPTTAGK